MESSHPESNGKHVMDTVRIPDVDLHAWAEELTGRFVALLRSQDQMPTDRSATPKNGRQEKKVKQKKPSTRGKIMEGVEIAASVPIPKFYQHARTLAQALFEGIQQQRGQSDLLMLQAQCLEHWARATAEDLRITGETEHRRDGNSYRPLYGREVYIDRAIAIHTGCKILLKQNASQRNPNIVPSMIGRTGFFDHHDKKLCTITEK